MYRGTEGYETSRKRRVKEEEEEEERKSDGMKAARTVDLKGFSRRRYIIFLPSRASRDRLIFHDFVASYSVPTMAGISIY